jgi:hypothetical protein
MASCPSALTYGCNARYNEQNGRNEDNCLREERADFDKKFHGLSKLLLSVGYCANR